MLFDILRLIHQGQLHSSHELAQTLNVPYPLIQQMTQQLAQQGYLAGGEMGCASGCGGCGLQKACNLPNNPQLWTLTQKGEAALRKQN